MSKLQLSEGVMNAIYRAGWTCVSVDDMNDGTFAITLSSFNSFPTEEPTIIFDGTDKDFINGIMETMRIPDFDKFAEEMAEKLDMPIYEVKAQLADYISDLDILSENVNSAYLFQKEYGFNRNTMVGRQLENILNRHGWEVSEEENCTFMDGSKMVGLVHSDPLIGARVFYDGSMEDFARGIVRMFNRFDFKKYQKERFPDSETSFKETKAVQAELENLSDIAVKEIWPDARIQVEAETWSVDNKETINSRSEPESELEH